MKEKTLTMRQKANAPVAQVSLFPVQESTSQEILTARLHLHVPASQLDTTGSSQWGTPAGINYNPFSYTLQDHQKEGHLLVLIITPSIDAKGMVRGWGACLSVTAMQNESHAY